MSKPSKGRSGVRNRQTAPVPAKPAGGQSLDATLALAMNAAGTPTTADANLDQPTGMGTSALEVIRKSNLWRDNYNPLRGLTIARLLAMFEAAERGAYAELQLLLRKVEKRYPVLKALKSRRLSALEKLDWDVKIMDRLPEGATPAMAETQQKFLKGRYELVKNLRESFGQLALAEIRGYAILQKHLYQDGANVGAVAELYWLEPWCWAKDGYYGDFFYNQDSRIGVGLGACSSILGEVNRVGSPELPRESFVIREVESPLYEITLCAFVNWLMGRKDWAAFVEIFGLPNGVVIMPPNIAVGKELDYQAAAQSVADGQSGALPNGADIKFPTAGVKGDAPFEKYCDAQDKDVVLAGTGGLLTMLSMPQGLGHGSSQQHGDAFEEIAHADALKVSETLQADFDRVELAAEFPGQPVCVYFELAAKDDEDIGKLADTVVKLEGVGLETDAAEVSARTGMKLVRVETPDPAAQKADEHIDKGDLNAAVRNRLAKMLNRANGDGADEFYQALIADLKPLHDRIAAIDQIANADIKRKKVAALFADLAQLEKDITADPAATATMEDLVTEAFLAGLAGGKPVQNREGQPRDNLGKWVDENGGGLSVKENSNPNIT